jgi:uncharacterized coiled-coil DUF342 family protein
MREKYGETDVTSGSWAGSWAARMTKLVSEMDDMRAELDEYEAMIVEIRSRDS